MWKTDNTKSFEASGKVPIHLSGFWICLGMSVVGGVEGGKGKRQESVTFKFEADQEGDTTKKLFSAASQRYRSRVFWLLVTRAE